ncbi:J domain-containing protein [Roseivirga sp.]|uniref:J domain-containing protein n=1 Tax=Roseivirga sp. TaxID=1964215 RepID=UPI003B51C417
MPKDYYAILGIEKTASEEEVKFAFRQKAKHLHPDVNSGADAQSAFQELNEAYSILSDPTTRVQYDRGDLEEPEVTFTWEEVEQILREREWKRQQANSGNRHFYNESEVQYPPMNFKANERASQLVNLAIMLFTFTLILDFFIFSEPFNDRVIEKRALVEENSGVIKKLVEVKTTHTKFYVSQFGYVPDLNEEVELKSSLFYKSHQFRTAGDVAFRRAYDKPIILYVLGALAFIISWLGTTKYLNAEQKFNAGVIAGFTCLPIIILILHSR